MRSNFGSPSRANGDHLEYHELAELGNNLRNHIKLEILLLTSPSLYDDFTGYKVSIQLGQLVRVSLWIPKISHEPLKMDETWPNRITVNRTRPSHQYYYLLNCFY